MTPLQIAAFRAHATTKSYKRKLETSIDIVGSLDPYICYVSFSAGKDSAVCAHMCHAVHPGVAILMVDPGCPTHWLESERDMWIDYADNNRWNLKLFAWDKWAEADTQTDDVVSYQSKIHQSMFADLHDYTDNHDLYIRVMGIRASESMARRMNIGVRGNRYDYVDGVHSAVLPVAKWQTEDIWAYIISNNVPWLGIYDKLGPNARNGLVGRSGEEFGRVEYLKMEYPDVWRWARLNNIF